MIQLNVSPLRVPSSMAGNTLFFCSSKNCVSGSTLTRSPLSFTFERNGIHPVDIPSRVSVHHVQKSGGISSVMDLKSEMPLYMTRPVGIWNRSGVPSACVTFVPPPRFPAKTSAGTSTSDHFIYLLLLISIDEYSTQTKSSETA